MNASVPAGSATGSPVVQAAFWMAAWLSLMLVMPVAGREAAHELHLVQVLEMRSLIGLLMIYPMVHRSGGFSSLRTSRIWLHISRNVVHYLAQYGWFLAITLIPLAQVVSIEFTMPLWTAFLAVLFLGERMTFWKNVAVALGLVGVVIIIRPGGADVNIGQLIALATAVGFGMSVTMVKSLTRTETALSIMFWMVVVQSAIGLVPALAVWRWPTPHVWGWVIVIAFCGTFSHYCMARALRYADATVVVPMDFLRVPLSALVGWLVYAERIDYLTAVGAMLILCGNLLNLKGAGAPAPRKT
jgi:drug/metabolite transporter (DMT)-like permease